MIKIGFIGLGNMAKAIIKNFKQKSFNFIIGGFDIAKSFNNICRELKIKIYKSNIDLVDNSDIIFLCVKPQHVSEVLTEIKSFIKNKLIISIAAGISIKRIHNLLSKKVPVVRIMPNTPVLVGEGACGYAFSNQVTVEFKKIAEKIINSFCKVSFQVPEKHIDTITSLSGSGPAYFFYITEAMIEQAKISGFDEKKAKILIAQTLIGAGKLLIKTDETPLVLRHKVTSKGGTTEAAINILEKNKLKEVIKNAVFAAYKRAKELGK